MNENRRHLPDFRVKYTCCKTDETGLYATVRQGIRSDWMYAEDFPCTIHQPSGQKMFAMIWPRFVDENGLEYSEWEDIPLEGFADMYIVNPEMKPFHRKLLVIGTKGMLVRGPHILANVEVVDILYLNHLA
jgi:hypothetical protein